VYKYLIPYTTLLISTSLSDNTKFIVFFNSTSLLNDNHLQPSKNVPLLINTKNSILNDDYRFNLNRNKIDESLVEMPVIARIKVKIKKTEPMKFIAVENSEGFI